MITTFDLTDIIYQKIKNSSLASSITGKIYKDQERPLNSTTEDVVINTLGINNLQLQQSVVNVNVFVPNLAQNYGELQNQAMPNFPRLKALAAIAITALKNTWSGDYNFDVQQQLLIQDPDTKDHYINIRLDFYNINISN